MAHVTCSVPDCDERATRRGWCETHYARWRKGGDVQPDIPIKRWKRGAICSVEGCEREEKSRGWCGGHYHRWLTTGEVGPAEFRKKPLRRISAAGYWRVWCPGHPMAAKDGYAQEHRKVLHDAGIEVGRFQHVHHLNGDKLDNRLENLEVLDASAHHRKHIAEAGMVSNKYGTWPVPAAPKVIRPISMPVDLYAAVRARAEAEGLSAAEAMRRVLRRYVDEAEAS